MKTDETFFAQRIHPAISLSSVPHPKASRFELAKGADEIIRAV